MKKSEMINGYLSVVASSLLWSLGGLFIKMIPWSAISINAARCIIALLFKTVLRRSVKIKFTKLSVIGGISMSATSILFTLANKLTTSANAIMIQFSFPLFLIIYTWIYTKQRPRRVEFATCFVILSGVFLCCLDNISSGGAVGNFLALISGITFSTYFFVNSLPDGRPDDANYLGFLISSLVGLPSLVRETVFSFDIVLYIIILGAFQLGLGYVLFEYGIKRIPAISASFISAIEPVMNPVWVALFYHEKIGVFAILGSIFVVGASLIYSLANIRQSKA